MQPLEEKAYVYLRDLLINGDYMPGTLLSENELAKQLEMSRTPVRAAISRLEGEGFLETVKNRGIFVKELSFKEFLDIFEVIFSFQYYQFNYQDRDFSQIDLSQLKKHLDSQLQCSKQHDYLGYVKHSVSFLRTMISGTKNVEMLKIIDGFFDKILRFSIINFKRTPHHSHYSGNEVNQTLYNAIIEKDYKTVKQTIEYYHEALLKRFNH